jgi:hypothetical protein
MPRMSSDPGDLGKLVARKQKGHEVPCKDDNQAPYPSLELHGVDVHDLKSILRDGSEESFSLIL